MPLQDRLQPTFIQFFLQQVRDPPRGPGDDSQSSRGPWVTPADTGKLRGEAEMQSAEAQHSRDSPYGKNLTATNDIPESPDPASAPPGMSRTALGQTLHLAGHLSPAQTR